MSIPKNSAISSSPPASAKERLTDNQKKTNHIESEKKRREAIRRNFERLSHIVPNMEGQARSEAIMLEATVKYIELELQKKAAIQRLALERGWTQEQINEVYDRHERNVRAEENARLGAEKPEAPATAASANIAVLPKSEQRDER